MYGTHLAVDASVVHNKMFDEGTVIKIIGSNGALLNLTDRFAMIELKSPAAQSKSASATDNETRTPLTYYERLEAKPRRLREAGIQFLDCRFIGATSPSVEHSFSAAR